ncbi:hypothetical protein DsansV1_C06g0058751 [Dioscorea sansibarensis]
MVFFFLRWVSFSSVYPSPRALGHSAEKKSLFDRWMPKSQTTIALEAYEIDAIVRPTKPKPAGN